MDMKVPSTLIAKVEMENIADVVGELQYFIDKMIERKHNEVHFIMFREVLIVNCFRKKQMPETEFGDFMNLHEQLSSAEIAWANSSNPQVQMIKTISDKLLENIYYEKIKLNALQSMEVDNTELLEYAKSPEFQEALSFISKMEGK